MTEQTNQAKAPGELNPQEAFMIALETAIQTYHRQAPPPNADGTHAERDEYVSSGFGVLGSVFGRYMCHVAYEQGFMGNNTEEHIVNSMTDALKEHILGAFVRKKAEIEEQLKG